MRVLSPSLFATSLLTLMLALVAPSAQAAVEVIDSATLQWTPASGSVAGYYVIVSRNGAAAEVEGMATETSQEIAGSAGDVVVVQVAAFGDDGAAGPVSEPSEALHFVSPPAPEPPPEPDPTPEPDPGPITQARHDLTCDGSSDLIVKKGDGGYQVWEIVDGQLARKIELPRARKRNRLVGAGDYNGDGCADLLWQENRSSHLTVWLLDDGSLLSRVVLDQNTLPQKENWRVAGSGDVDGDGVDDIVLHSRKARAMEVWTMQAGAIAAVDRLDGRANGWSMPDLTDTDGDGGSESLWFEQASGQLDVVDPATGEEQSLWQLTDGWLPMAAADFDGDGAGEVLTHNAASGGTACLGTRAGDEGVTPLPNAAGRGRPVGFGDYDADGLDDIAWFDSETGVIRLWLAEGTQEVALDESLASGSTVEEALGSSD